MKKLLFLLFLFCFSYGTPKQDKFIIGGWVDPDPSFAQYKLFADAHFNLITATHYWKYSANASRTETIGKLINDHFPGQLQFLIYEKHKSELKSLHSKTTGLDRTNMLGISYYLNTYGPSSGYKYRQHMYGYRLLDEPYYSHINECVEKLTYFQHMDPQKLVWANLYPARSTSFLNNGIFNETRYKDYVQKMIDGGAKVISFDYYPFVTNESVSSYPKTLIRPQYYRNYEIVAELCKNANLPFWAFSELTHHEDLLGVDAYGNPINVVHCDGIFDNKPNANSVRFAVSIGLVHGSKGIIYHTYNDPQADPENSSYVHKSNPTPPYSYQVEVNGVLVNKHQLYYNPTTSVVQKDGTVNYPVYNFVKDINKKVSDIGGLLVQLDWKQTLHGKETDCHPTSLDNISTGHVGPATTGLKTIIGKSNYVANVTSDKLESLVIGEFTKEGEVDYGYMLVVNKDIHNYRSFSFDFKRKGNHYYYDHSSNSWKILNNSITIEPGGFVLTKVRRPAGKIVTKYLPSLI